MQFDEDFSREADPALLIKTHIYAIILYKLLIFIQVINT